jgi:NADPH-dependent ferric siderophore reductase
MSAPAPRRPRLLQVRQIIDITPSLRRITLHSDELADYPDAQGGAHIKLMFAQPGQAHPVLPELTERGPRWADPASKPVMRTFTLRALRRERGELDVEFALHGGTGPAARFIEQVKPGDWLGLSAPGGPQPMLPPARRYYLAGDLTALPAIAALVSQLPADATGAIAVLVPTAADIQPFALPAGIAIHWEVGGREQHGALQQWFCLQASDASDSHFWLAGEQDLVLPLRRHVRRTLGADRAHVYAVPYWRAGRSEEEYHDERHEVMDAEA